MDQEFSYGQMVLNMRVNGVKTKQMALENSGMLMEMYMKEIGKKTKLTDMECTSMSMEHDMKVNGKMIFKMEQEPRAGLMDLSIKEAIKRA